MMVHAIVVIVLLAVVGSASAEEAQVWQGDSRSVSPSDAVPSGITWRKAPIDPEDPFTSRFPFRRPLDDSDPEMREMAVAYFSQGPCNRGPGRKCLGAVAPLVAGGDRLAEYLITQYEENVAEGYPDTAPYLIAIGGTQSAAGFSYVERLIFKPRDKKERDFALRALSRCNSDVSLDLALQLLDESDDSDIRKFAANAIDFHLLTLDHERPDAISKLREIADDPSEHMHAKAIARRVVRRIDQAQP